MEVESATDRIQVERCLTSVEVRQHVGQASEVVLVHRLASSHRLRESATPVTNYFYTPAPHGRLKFHQPSEIASFDSHLPHRRRSTYPLAESWPRYEREHAGRIQPWLEGRVSRQRHSKSHDPPHVRVGKTASGGADNGVRPQILADVL